MNIIFTIGSNNSLLRLCSKLDYIALMMLEDLKLDAGIDSN